MFFLHVLGGMVLLALIPLLILKIAHFLIEDK